MNGWPQANTFTPTLLLQMPRRVWRFPCFYLPFRIKPVFHVRPLRVATCFPNFVSAIRDQLLLER